MSGEESFKGNIPIIDYDEYEGIDFYNSNDFHNIDSKCPKCLSEAVPEYCFGCRGCYCGSSEVPDFCEVCKKPYHHYCDEDADNCPRCHGLKCTNINCQYRFAVIEKSN